jgi:hypothetical protein
MEARVVIWSSSRFGALAILDCHHAGESPVRAGILPPGKEHSGNYRLDFAHE